MFLFVLYMDVTPSYVCLFVFREQVGLRYLRGAEIIEIRDRDGNAFTGVGETSVLLFVPACGGVNM